MTEHSTTTVDILRHGACTDGDILRGRTDSPLSAQGRDQMTTALAPLSGWQAVVTSPLARCRSYAEDFAERHRLPLNIKPDWREVDFGDWDGQLLDKLYTDQSGALDAYYRHPGETTPPNGEALSLASERVSNAWRQLLREHRGDHVLVICHGGVIRLLLAALQNAPLTATHFFHIPYGGLTRLHVHHGPDRDFVRLAFHR